MARQAEHETPEVESSAHEPWMHPLGSTGPPEQVGEEKFPSLGSSRGEKGSSTQVLEEAHHPQEEAMPQV